MSRKNLVRVAVVTVVVLAVGAGAFYYLNTPAEGVVDQPEANQRPTPRSTSPVQLDGRSMRLTYPGIYLQRLLPATTPDLEIHQLSADTNYKKQVIVSVSELPEGKLSNNSAYLLRESRAATYTKRSENISNKQVEIWERTDQTELAAFLVDGQRVAIIIAIQEGGEKAALQAEMRSLLTSFSWK